MCGWRGWGREGRYQGMLVRCTSPSSTYWLWVGEVALGRETELLDMFAALGDRCCEKRDDVAR